MLNVEPISSDPESTESVDVALRRLMSIRVVIMPTAAWNGLIVREGIRVR